MSCRDKINNLITIIGEIDCLISLGENAAKHNLTRPILTKESVIKLKDSRNLLYEFSVSEFISNDFEIETNFNRISIFTSPNCTGKSVFLKQVYFKITIYDEMIKGWNYCLFSTYWIIYSS